MIESGEAQGGTEDARGSVGVSDEYKLVSQIREALMEYADPWDQDSLTLEQRDAFNDELAKFIAARLSFPSLENVAKARAWDEALVAFNDWDDQSAAWKSYECLAKHRQSLGLTDNEEGQ